MLPAVLCSLSGFLLPSSPLFTASRSRHSASIAASASLEQNVLLLDHLNINHAKGRHDLLSAFYFDLLGCAPDPRKEDNLLKGRKTLWANLGITQFHLPEADVPQVWEGVVTLGYVSLEGVRGRLAAGAKALEGTRFSVTEEAAGSLLLVDPWGTKFKLVEMGDQAKDGRGSQKGEPSEEGRLVDLLCDVSADANLEGIGRFYEQVLGCEVGASENRVTVSTGPGQTLSFARASESDTVAHEDLALTDEGEPCNLGPHISIYLRNMGAAYARADALGITYVNHRFKRRAYNREEATARGIERSRESSTAHTHMRMSRHDSLARQAIEQCMFRILEVVDPEDVGAGPIVRLEHEVRSITKADGGKYKSCPLELEACLEVPA